MTVERKKVCTSSVASFLEDEVSIFSVGEPVERKGELDKEFRDEYMSLHRYCPPEALRYTEVKWILRLSYSKLSSRIFLYCLQWR